MLHVGFETLHTSLRQVQRLSPKQFTKYVLVVPLDGECLVGGFARPADAHYQVAGVRPTNGSPLQPVSVLFLRGRIGCTCLFLEGTGLFAASDDGCIVQFYKKCDSDPCVITAEWELGTRVRLQMCGIPVGQTHGKFQVDRTKIFSSLQKMGSHAFVSLLSLGA